MQIFYAWDGSSGSCKLMFNLPPGAPRRPAVAGNCSLSEFIVCTLYFSRCFLYFVLPVIWGSQAHPLHHNTMSSLCLTGRRHQQRNHSGQVGGLLWWCEINMKYASTLAIWQTQSWSEKVDWPRAVKLGNTYTQETKGSDCLCKYGIILHRNREDREDSMG